MFVQYKAGRQVKAEQLSAEPKKKKIQKKRILLIQFGPATCVPIQQVLLPLLLPSLGRVYNDCIRAKFPAFGLMQIFYSIYKIR